jgi:hypothetical protein
MNTIAIHVLADFVIRKVEDCSIDEQIPLWLALSKILPDGDAREHAREIGRLQSEVSARKLQFKDCLAVDAIPPVNLESN